MLTIKSRSCALDLFGDVGSLGGPDEGLGAFVAVVDVVVDGANKLLDATEGAGRSRSSVRSRKNRSTMFSHEQL